MGCDGDYCEIKPTNAEAGAKLTAWLEKLDEAKAEGRSND